MFPDLLGKPLYVPLTTVAVAEFDAAPPRKASLS
jgi:hypothetical protein